MTLVDRYRGGEFAAVWDELGAMVSACAIPTHAAGSRGRRRTHTQAAC
jgi:hypothetical protein